MKHKHSAIGRRTFLKTAMVSAVAAALPPGESPASQFQAQSLQVDHELVDKFSQVPLSYGRSTIEETLMELAHPMASTGT